MALVAVLVSLFLLIRLYLAYHQTLWTDELWSLSVATGHSLLCALKGAQVSPERGDYVDQVGLVTAAYYQQYLAFDDRCKLPDAIIRACLRADWNSPLYYLFLWLWLKFVGISDFSVRLPSIIVSLATLPFMWSIAKKLGNYSAALYSSALFALAPICVYYSTEARVYACTIFLSAVLLWLTLEMAEGASQRSRFYMIAWIVVSALGFSSTVLFISAFLPCLLWLKLHRRDWSIGRLLFMLIGSCAPLFLYLTIPLFFARDSEPVYVTGPTPLWLAPSRPISHLLAFFYGPGIQTLEWYCLFGIVVMMVSLPLIPVILPVSRKHQTNFLCVCFAFVTFFLSGAVELVLASLDLPSEKQMVGFFLSLLGALTCVCFTWWFAKKSNFEMTENFDGRLRLLYLITILAVTLPTIFDLMGTHAGITHRYVLVCLPAVFTLFAIALSKCGKPLQILFGLLTVIAWAPSYGQFAFSESMMQEYYKEIAQVLSKASKDDLILIDGPYSMAMVGVGRYLPKDQLLLSRCEQKKRRPEDLLSALPSIQGKSGVYLVRFHRAKETADALEEWLAKNGKLEQAYYLHEKPANPWTYNQKVLYFRPLNGAVF